MAARPVAPAAAPAAPAAAGPGMMGMMGSSMVGSMAGSVIGHGIAKTMFGGSSEPPGLSRRLPVPFFAPSGILIH